MPGRLITFAAALLVVTITLSARSSLESSSLPQIAQRPTTTTAPAPASDLGARFTTEVRPFVDSYCAGCHGGRTPAAQFDLRAYSTIDDVVRDYSHWDLALEKLKAQQMPPAQAKQPPPEARQQVVAWIEAVRRQEAQRHAGDPGIVLARRLSNAEYNYTIRDLTGVDIRPAREFPVDPANPAGFDNTGESLAMSPALLTKYLQAAQEVANHLVLKPNGFTFAPHPMLVETDRDKYTVNQIIDFYRRHSTDYADFFGAAWRYKHRVALGNPTHTLAQAAAEQPVSAKYLATIWRTLEQTREDVGPLVTLHAMWRALPAPTASQRSLPRSDLERMRDFVVALRKKTAITHTELAIKGIGDDAQPFLMWRNEQYAASRRDFNRAALKTSTETSDVDLQIPDGDRARYEAAFARFSLVFPDAFYVSERGRYFPDNSRDVGRHLSAGFHNLMGYFRDDRPFYDLILDERQQQELDALWRDMDFVASTTSRTYVQFYLSESGAAREAAAEASAGRSDSASAITDEASIQKVAASYLERARPSGNAVAIKAIENHFGATNATIRWTERARRDAEPSHLTALVEFAARAFRRPLSTADRDDVLAFYRAARSQGLDHSDAMRDAIVAILMSPDFCYRIDLIGNAATAGAAKTAQLPVLTKPLSDQALASRLSYFLWSSMPDAELMRHATAGDLHRPEVLVAQARRMLKDSRIRGLATEFGGNWLDFRRFEEHNAVDRDRFPVFDNDLRTAMFEEPVRFMLDVFTENRSVLDFLYAKHTFVNRPLAKHYGMPDVPSDAWIRVDDATAFGRGGVLPMAVFLTKNAPGLRTSPVKRGYWVVKQVLGEQIPPPPAVVPELPRDEAKLDLPLRDLLARHRSDPMCASCHARFDAMGLVFEGYGPVGERRIVDLSGRAVDASATFPSGESGTGFDGLRAYVRAKRQDDFIKNLSRKLLAYALNRSLLLSDEPTVDVMQAQLTKDGYRFGSLIDSIVTSSQFRNKRHSEETQ